MQLVSTVTVGAGGAASIEFTSIPQTGTDLLVLLSHRDSGSFARQITLGLRVNANSGSIYTALRLRGTGSATNSTTTSSFSTLVVGDNEGQDNSTTANTFSNSSFYLPNYTSSANKSVSIDSVSETNATNIGQFITAGLAATTSAITSLQLFTGIGSTFVQNSTASLYIITKA